jgi:hypothetical protein
MTYRKLPGQRRGFLHGASLWMGADHILAVRSLRFREEYKRFYLRDIQAIVVATRSRFHVSTRVAAISALWLAVWLAMNRAPWVPAVMSVAAIGLVLWWLYVSYSRSCSCRIYTAVSRDDLPSIYRTWTARRFLAEVEPRIREVQGTLPGDWAEAVENSPAGPAVLPPGSPAIQPTSAAPRRRTLVSDIFVASLFANAALDFLTLRTMTRTTEWMLYGLNFVEIGSAIFIFLQHHRGILRAAIERLAIATLILMGIAYYVGQILAGVAMGNRMALPDPAVLATLPGHVVLRQVEAGVCLILALVGLALALMPESDTV